MARVPSLPTSTLSVCVDPDEAQLIRDAAADSKLTVSAWCAARVMEALSTPKKRAAALEVAKRIAEAPTVSRTGRASMVLQKQYEGQIKNLIKPTSFTSHAFMQGAVLEAAERQVEAMQPGRALAIERAKREAPGTKLVAVPKALATLDKVQVARGVVTLLEALQATILKGTHLATVKGAPAMAKAAAAAGEMVTIRLPVPDFELRAVAWLLGIDHNLLLTALVMKVAAAVRNRDASNDRQ